MDKRIKYIMVLDVETAGGLGNPLVYDIGFAVTDKKGRIYASKSFIISEIFRDKNLMNTAYYAKKVPMYLEDLAQGTRIETTFMNMRKEFLELMQAYNIQTISAYNLNFDSRALKNTMKYITGHKRFLTNEQKNIKMLCIWSLACETLYIQKTYKHIAQREGWVSEKGNLMTKAEQGHRYITGIYGFEEEHTGLEDTLIEIGIMAYCYRQHKKHQSGILANPWKIVKMAHAI